MATFYVTFQIRYEREDEVHPKFPAAHPNGYLSVEADSYGQAIDQTQVALNNDYAFIYSDEPESWLFPKGVIGWIDVDGVHEGINPNVVPS